MDPLVVPDQCREELGEGRPVPAALTVPSATTEGSA
jgi:hypothetical protein